MEMGKDQNGKERIRGKICEAFEGEGVVVLELPRYWPPLFEAEV